MKRYIFLWIVSIFLSLPFLRADNFVSAQSRFQKSLIQFLSDEGFSPISGEGSDRITFKNEGVIHWIMVYNESPFYVEVHRTGESCDDADKVVALMACNYANSKIRSAKAVYDIDNKGVSFAVEMFCHSEEEFRYVFYKCLKVLDSICNSFKDFSEKHSKDEAPFSISAIEVGIQDEKGKVITQYGDMLFDFRTQYLAPEITAVVNQSGEYELFIKLFDTKGKLSVSEQSPSGYSYSHKVKMSRGTMKYALSGWGNGKSGHWPKGTYRLEIFYKGERLATKSFIVH